MPDLSDKLKYIQLLQQLWQARIRGLHGINRVSGVVKFSRKYKLDCIDLQGRSREGTKKRALQNGNKKHKNYRVEIWAGGALLFVGATTTFLNNFYIHSLAVARFNRWLYL